MPSISLKDEVARAIRSEWPAFEHEHPRLAAVLDETMLIDQATQSLADDEDFQHTMATAAAAGIAAEAATELIRRLVGRWLKTLI